MPNSFKSVGIVSLLSVILVIVLCMPVSADQPVAWSAPIQLSDPAEDATNATIIRHGDGYLVAWSGERSGNREIYLLELTSLLAPSGDIRRMTYEPGDDTDPMLFGTSSGDIWLLWSSDRHGTYDIMARVLHGTVWSPPQAVVQTDRDETDPTGCEEKDGLILMAWQSGQRGSYDIYARYYEEGSLLEPVAVATGPKDDVEPHLTKAADGNIWLVWVSIREGDWAVYYKSAPVYVNPLGLRTMALPGSSGNSSSPAAIDDGAMTIVWSEQIHDIPHAAVLVGASWATLPLENGFPAHAAGMQGVHTGGGELCIAYSYKTDSGMEAICVTRTGRAELSMLADAQDAIGASGLPADAVESLDALYDTMIDVYNAGQFGMVQEHARDINEYITAYQQPEPTTPPPATTTPPTTPAPTQTAVPPGQGGWPDMATYAVAGAALIAACIIVVAVVRSRDSNTPPAPQVKKEGGLPKAAGAESARPQGQEPFPITQKEPEIITPQRPYVDVHMPKSRQRDVVYIDPSYSRQYPPDSQALEEVPFVGYALAPDFRKAGITDIGALARASPQDISGMVGISQSLAKIIIMEARKLLGKVSP